MWAKRVCSGVLCRLIYLLLLLRTGLYSGCSGGTVASRIAACEHHFSTISTAGRRKAQALRVSVGEVRRAPVMAIAPLHWMVANHLRIADDPSILFLVLLIVGGPHHTSAPYRILGSTTPM